MAADEPGKLPPGLAEAAVAFEDGDKDGALAILCRRANQLEKTQGRVTIYIDLNGTRAGAFIVFQKPPDDAGPLHVALWGAEMARLIGVRVHELMEQFLRQRVGGG